MPNKCIPMGCCSSSMNSYKQPFLGTAPCGHAICAQYQHCGGVAVVVVNNYNRNGIRAKVVLLGKERGGKYKGAYNFCAGKTEAHDSKCFIAAARRELDEEFKLSLSTSSFNNKLKKCFTHGRTVVFVIECTGLSRQSLNPAISKALNNPHLPHHLKEMEHVDWFRMDSLQQLEGRSERVSSFVRDVMPKVAFYKKINWIFFL